MLASNKQKQACLKLTKRVNSCRLLKLTADFCDEMDILFWCNSFAEPS